VDVVVVVFQLCSYRKARHRTLPGYIKSVPWSSLPWTISDLVACYKAMIDHTGDPVAELIYVVILESDK
jgi:hypothetical protein